MFVDNLNFLKDAFRKNELNYRYSHDHVYTLTGKMRGGIGNGRAGIINGYFLMILMNSLGTFSISHPSTYLF